VAPLCGIIQVHISSSTSVDAEEEYVIMRKVIGLLTFLIGLVVGLVGGAALLAYAYQAAGLYPPDDATIKFIARERGWLKEEV
jgi:hypothetical protein